MFKQLSHLLKSGEVKRLLENFFSLSILKLVNAILPFVTLPYLIKVLGFQQYGAIVLALSLITYFQAITDYGFNLSATREIAQHRHSNKQLIYIYNKTMISKIILLIFSLLCLCGLILFVPQFRADFLVYSLMCLMLIGQTLFPEWFFRGVEQMRYITIFDLIIKTSFTLCVFFFIKKPEDYWIYPLIFGLSYIFVGIFSNIFLLKNYQIRIVKIKLNIVKKNLKSGFPLFINQFVPNLFNNTTNFLVGMILGKSAAGMFGATRQVIQILTVFNSVVSTTFFPYLVKNKNSFKTYRKFYLSTFLFLFFLIWILHNNIFNFLGIYYIGLEEVFLFLLLGVLCIVIYSIYATNYLIVRGKDNIVMRITLLASLVGFLCAFPLIKYFGIVGGAFNIFIGQFILGVGSYIYFKKHSLGNSHEF
ncbi:oligosaccharide flippase family protein [Acinetobacter sp. 22323]|uniref:oligosaccharide flippase family protein n=1 Tax=Acinetobacter sp. 22323 TaxID=3453910 RepID=UPI003F868E75